MVHALLLLLESVLRPRASDLLPFRVLLESGFGADLGGLRPP